MTYLFIPGLLPRKRPKLTQSSSGKWSDFSSEAGSPGRNLRQLEDESFSPGRSPGRDPREEGRDERRALAAVKTYLDSGNLLGAYFYFCIYWFVLWTCFCNDCVCCALTALILLSDSRV